MNFLRDAPGDMRVSSGDFDAVTLLVDGHDPLQRPLRFLALLLRLDQRDDLVAMVGEELALEGDEAGGEAIGDAAARGTSLLVHVAGRIAPLPAAVREDRV